MRANHRHLTHQELLQAIDHEVPPRRQPSVERHLEHCEDCQARQLNLEQTLLDSTRLYQQYPSPVGPAHYTRERLRARMHAEAGDRTGGPAVHFMFGPRLVAVALAIVVGILCLRQPRSPIVAFRTTPSAEATDRPIARLTPGATWELSLNELCDGTRHEQRQMADSVRQQVLKDYHMERVSPDEYELDYLITPELGGAPDARNLWPERYTAGVWNARVKDQLEGLLPQLVCNRQLALETAQREIAVDWIAAYRKYFKTDAPLRMQASLDDVGEDREGLSFPIWWSHGTSSPRLISFPPGR